MNKPIFRDTSHLTEEQKCVLALQQALEQEHGEYRIHELQDRLLKFSIMNLSVGLSIFEDEEDEDSYS
jgi:hypothetical protein